MARAMANENCCPLDGSHYADSLLPGPGCTQMTAGARTMALARAQRMTPREAVSREAAATMPTLVNASKRPDCLRIKRNPPKPRARIQETSKKFWNRPALTKNDVGR